MPAATSKLDAIRKYLGLTLKALTPEDAAQLGLQNNGGLLVTHVDDHSPAGDAGLRNNMVIVKIGNRPITDAKSLPHELLQMQAAPTCACRSSSSRRWDR